MSSILLAVIFLVNLVLSSVIPQTDLKLSVEEQSHLEGDPSVTHKVVFTIKHGDELLGDLTLALFGETCPITVENFYQLAIRGEDGQGYKNSKFHRIINNFVIQGGDYDGHGGKLIYGDSFNDENFILKHNKLGRLSMANVGPNTNGGQFFILNGKPTPHLDGHHVVFGQLVDGFDTLQKISTVETKDSSPLKPVVISDVKTAIDKSKVNQKEEAGTSSTSETEGITPVSTSVYSYLFIILLLGVVFAAYKMMPRRDQITTIKD